MSPRMTKEELREDPVLERIQKGITFTTRHARWFAAAAIVVVALIVAVIAVRRARVSNAREVAQYLAEAQSSYLTGNLPTAETQLRQLIDNYGGTEAARVARIYLGDALLSQDRAQDALTAYEDALRKAGGDALFTSAAQRGIGSALEDLGENAEASQAYERAAQSGSLSKVDDLICAGRTALKAGDPSRAKTLLKQAQSGELSGRRTEIAAYLAQAEAALQ